MLRCVTAPDTWRTRTQRRLVIQPSAQRFCALLGNFATSAWVPPSPPASGRRPAAVFDLGAADVTVYVDDQVRQLLTEARQRARGVLAPRRTAAAE